MARIDARMSSIEAWMSSIESHMSNIEASISSIEARLSNLEAMVTEARNSISGLKSTMILSAVGAVLGIAMLNATVMSNMVAAFGSSQHLRETEAKIDRQLEKNAALLTQIQQGLLVPAPKPQPAK